MNTLITSDDDGYITNIKKFHKEIKKMRKIKEIYLTMKARSIIAPFAGATSVFLNFRNGIFFSDSRLGLATGTAIILGLLCIWFPNAFCGLASFGIRPSRPKIEPPFAFIALGWIFLFASFAPLIF